MEEKQKVRVFPDGYTVSGKELELLEKFEEIDRQREEERKNTPKLKLFFQDLYSLICAFRLDIESRFLYLTNKEFRNSFKVIEEIRGKNQNKY